jgi:hypothetical protein
MQIARVYSKVHAYREKDENDDSQSELPRETPRLHEIGEKTVHR